MDVLNLFRTNARITVEHGRFKRDERRNYAHLWSDLRTHGVGAFWHNLLVTLGLRRVPPVEYFD